jgi:hypothetical protein
MNEDLIKIRMNDLVGSLQDRLAGIEPMAYMYIREGEYRLALEMLADKLYESNKTISRAEYDALSGLFNDIEEKNEAYDTGFLNDLLEG